jgi:hypothetical protein
MWQVKGSGYERFSLITQGKLLARKLREKIRICDAVKAHHVL